MPMVVDRLAPLYRVDMAAVQSGNWSNAATWGGAVPSQGARVHVPSGMTVTVDHDIAIVYFWVRVDGVMQFADGGALRADTVLVSHTGRYVMGTETALVTNARLIITPHNNAHIDWSWDPLEFSRGLIAESPVSIYGRTKTTWLALAALPAAGATTLSLSAAPVNWQPGDRLVVAGTTYGQDETVTVTGVTGSAVTITPALKFARVLPTPTPAGAAVHVGNYTRSVQISSAVPGDLKRQGHVMLMGPNHRVFYAEFNDLGRTTIRPVTDPVVSEDGVRDPSLCPTGGLVAENVRGRYALHFHLAGPASALSIAEGNSVTTRRNAGFKIGIINHSSNVSIRKNVTHQIDGSHLFTEEGDEVGDFTANFGVYSLGSDFPFDEQPGAASMKKTECLSVYHRRRLDAGHQGNFIWNHSGEVEVIDNVGTAHASSVFDHWPRALDHLITNTFHVAFPTTLLRDGGPWALGKSMVEIQSVPFIYRGNQAYVTGARRYGLQACYELKYVGIHQTEQYPQSPYSVFDTNIGWNCRNFVVTQYAGRIRFTNAHGVRGNVANPSLTSRGFGLASQGGNNMIVENSSARGYTTCETHSSTTIIKSLACK